METHVDIGDIKDLLIVMGYVNEDKLDLRATVNSGDAATQVYREQEIRFTVGDAANRFVFAASKMSGLRVGQRWTFQSYQPLTPYRPLALIEATVEQEELLEWNGQMVHARKVVYRRDAGSGISSARQALAEMWVARSGEVLRHDLRFANARIQFVRQVGPAESEVDESDSAHQVAAIGLEHGDD